VAQFYLSPIIAMKVKYLWQKSPTGSFYFKRRVPEDILPFVGGKAFIQECLHTRDPKEAARQIAKLVQRTDQEWEFLRNPSRTTTVAQAKQLLRERGIDPAAPTENTEARDLFFEMVEGQLPEKVREEHHIAHQEGWTVGPKEIEKHLPPATAIAFAMAQGRMEFLASDCRDQYIQARAYTSRAVKAAGFPFKYLIELFGDRDLGKYRRAEANQLVRHLLSGAHSSSGKGIATTTIERYITTLRAAWERAIKENELSITNPWKRVEIPKLGQDAQKRDSFTVSDYRVLYAAVDAIELDALRCILTIVAETGARLAEVVGLAVADCHLRAQVPYINVRPHQWRSLKTSQSTRNVPLTERAQRAVKTAIELRKDSPYLFPRYTSNEKCKADTVSSGLNKWLRSRLPEDRQGLSMHSFRHGTRDLLREVRCPDSVANQLQGWESEGQGAKYGAGYSLGQLREWLEKATSLYASPDH